MGTYLLVDSGTSHTRVRLWCDGRIAASAERAVGSRDCAAAGHNGVLLAALREAIAEARRGAHPTAVICSGMISSNLGLIEVPHLTVPLSPDTLAHRLFEVFVPELCDLAVYLVPGLKTVPEGLVCADNLGQVDLMRGEETEVVGLLDMLQPALPALFFHLGSHHKAIRVDQTGRISASRTALTGELLQAVRAQTILANSTLPEIGYDLPQDMWRMGLALARQEGLGRALFLVRAAEQVWERDRAETTALLLGALLDTDLKMLANMPEHVETTVIYGKGAFGPMLRECLQDAGYGAVQLLDAEQSGWAAVRGAVWLFERASAPANCLPAPLL